MKHLSRRCLAGLLLALTFVCATAHGESWRFAVIGDTPYSDYERHQLPAMLHAIDEAHPAFIVHAGDIKHSKTRCSDALFLDRYALFDATRAPFVLVPGDNEWTDCNRLSAGGFDPLERLNRLREIFFAQPRSLGRQPMPLERQSDAYPEHLRWQLGPVLFVTLNVPGGNNHFGVGDRPSAEFLARNATVIDWLRQGFAAARAARLRGIAIVMQANPGFNHFAAGLAHGGYRELLEALRKETLAFEGETLLIHGDTHWQRVDHPLRDPADGRIIPRFTRLETFGYPVLGWVKVFIDDQAPSLFRFEAYPFPPPAPANR